MNKMLALLLVLMLPFGALSETYGVSFSIDTDEQLFYDYLRTELISLSDTAYDAQLDTTIRLIQKLLDGFAVELAMQDDAVAVIIQMGGGNLLDMVFHAEEDELAITSSLIDGYALIEDMAKGSRGEGATEDALGTLNWPSLLDAARNEVSQWIDNLNPVVTEGSFVGDAFEGGTKCKTWALTDRDIADLIARVVSGDVREAISLALTAMGFDAEEMLAGFDELNDRVSADNMYQYLVRSVSNDTGELVGVSLTIYTKSAQLATVSMGLKDKAFELVFGFGLQDQNYWCEFTANRSGKGNLTMLSGKSTEWVAEKNQGFAYVQKRISPVSNMAWYCNVTQSGKRYLWDASVYEGDKANYAYYCSSAGTVNPSTGVLDCSFSIGDAPYTPLTLNVQCGPVEEIPSLDGTIERCSVDNQPKYQELMEQMSAAFVARMLKLIPLDILLQLNIPEIP